MGVLKEQDTSVASFQRILYNLCNDKIQIYLSKPSNSYQNKKKPTQLAS